MKGLSPDRALHGRNRRLVGCDGGDRPASGGSSSFERSACVPATVGGAACAGLRAETRTQDEVRRTYCGDGRGKPFGEPVPDGCA